ncbi:MAG: hypothetical protein ACFFBP_14605 [Promethearchaeota archaeon]
MICIHGLDDNNCPICRINASTIPKDSIKIYELHVNELKPYYHESTLKADTVDKINSKTNRHKSLLKMTSINPVPEAKTLNELPNFENKMFQERLNELSFDKSDKIKLLKKISLESPEWKFEEK